MWIINLSWFVIACAVLILSGMWLVKSLTKISRFLKITEFAAAFIIMAIATSLPELFVGVSSALSKNTPLVIGMIIGSNIANLALIGGIVILLARGIKMKNIEKKDSWFMLICCILPIVLFLIGNVISRIDGIILLGVFVIYTYRKIKKERQFSKEFEEEEEKPLKRTDIVLTTLLFAASLVALFVSSNFVVKYASLLSIDLALPPIMIGFFLLAIGTSLPELVFGARAAQKGYADMAIGNIMGSVIVNATLILGVTAIIYPITGQAILFLTAAAFMVLLAFLFITFILSESKLEITEGISLILLYVFFIIIEFHVTGIV